MQKIDENTELAEYVGVNGIYVYRGYFSHLERADDQLKWRTDENNELNVSIRRITLREIADQLNCPIITVFCDDALHGEIYQYGNYMDGNWYNVGDYLGYA